MRSRGTNRTALLIFLILTVLSFESTLCKAIHQASSSRSSRSIPIMKSKKDTRSYFASTVVISPAGADMGMAAAQAEAIANGWDVTICICDAGGVPIQVRRNNAFPASYDIAVGKARSAALFTKETGQLEDAVNIVEGQAMSRTALLSASSFVLIRGGVPVILDGVCCGAVGVSGVQASQDEQVARVAADAMSEMFRSHQINTTSNQVAKL